MPKRTLTDAAVKRLKPPKTGQIDLFDAGYPGLALRVSYGGSKTWVYFYRLRGKQFRLSLGRYPEKPLSEAREAWRVARQRVAKGETPGTEKASTDDSFVTVADEWLRRDQADNRSIAEVRRVIERDVKPVWRGRLVANIGRREILELIDSINDRGATTLARRVHAHLHRLFRWSVGRGILQSNPMADLPKPGAVVRRDRVLADRELAAIWRASSHTAWPFGALVQLLILTGARRDEISSLRWSEIDGDTIRLTGQRTKNGELHNIPLSREAMAIIHSLPRVADGDFVFTTTGRTAVSGFSKAKSLLDAAAAEIYGRQIPPWRFHDFRRTVATNLQKLGVGLQTIEAVLGHVSGSRAGIVSIYQRHAFDPEKRAALEGWGRYLQTMVAADGTPLPSHQGNSSAATKYTET